MRDKKLWSLTFQIRAFPCFTFLYKKFYKNNIKIVPLDIFRDLTPLPLTYWIMGDGTSIGNFQRRLNICTDSYTLTEVILLMNVLMIKYNLDCRLVEHSTSSKGLI